MGFSQGTSINMILLYVIHSDNTDHIKCVSICHIFLFTLTVKT